MRRFVLCLALLGCSAAQKPVMSPDQSRALEGFVCRLYESEKAAAQTKGVPPSVDAALETLCAELAVSEAVARQ